MLIRFSCQYCSQPSKVGKSQEIKHKQHHRSISFQIRQVNPEIILFDLPFSSHDINTLSLLSYQLLGGGGGGLKNQIFAILKRLNTLESFVTCCWLLCVIYQHAVFVLWQHITIESFTPCLLDLCKALWGVMLSYYQTMQWHESHDQDSGEQPGWNHFSS